MSKQTIVNYDNQGNVVSTTRITRSSGCGCGAAFTVLTGIFVLWAPAYYAGQGNWPLGWVGAALSYLFLAIVIVAGAAAAMRSRQT